MNSSIALELDTNGLPKATAANIVALEDAGDYTTANFLFYQATASLGELISRMNSEIAKIRQDQEVIEHMAADRGISIAEARKIWLG
jgi:hypothetical protein